MIAAGNRCFYNLRQIFRSRAMSKAVTIKIYTTMVKTFVEFGSGTWAMTEMVMTRLGTWERKMLKAYMDQWYSEEYGEKEELIRN